MHDPQRAREVAREVHRLLQRRSGLLLALPMQTLDRVSLQSQARAIASQTGAAFHA
jgi:hypothetical protein